MNLAIFPLPALFIFGLGSLFRTPFFFSSHFMYYFGVISSVLTNAAIFGIPMLLASPVMIIYTMIIAIPITSSWSVYQNYLTTISSQSWLAYVSMVFEARYHYATGFSSVLVYTLIKSMGIS